LITAVDVEHKRYRPAAAVGSLETVENNGKGRCLVLLDGALSLIAAFVKVACRFCQIHRQLSNEEFG
jgi:hypothetical protein